MATPSAPVTDSAIALSVMAGEDPLYPQTVGSQGSSQQSPDEARIQRDASRANASETREMFMKAAGALARQ